MVDPFDLTRFVQAQAPVIETVLAELKQGRKQTHWMWFVFPQVAGLGRSPTAQFFAISGLAEARAYLAHPILGPRLLACTALVNAVEGHSAHQIFGSPDDQKFRSSMTLFAEAADEPEVFRTALAKYFGGEADPETSRRLK
ncbi:MAG: DUF1810 domain-containing protein [Pseudomonadota bacterium]